MKANELRIGNYILYLNELYVILGVSCTMKDDGTTYYRIQFSTIDSKLKNSKTENWIIPVPLTPEILEKCEFDWSIYHQAYHKDNFDFDMQESYPSGYTLTTFKKHLIIAPSIFYLHQLQNLYFALTGEELTFKP